MVLVSPRPQQCLPISQLKVQKICPLPVKSFIGRKKILDKMCHYFDTDHKGQHVFVLHGLGGSGKSQLAFKFLEDSKNYHQYDSFKTLIHFQMIYSYIIFRFSKIFYIDATTQQTLEAD